MTSYRPVDSKREEFRKYLEKAGAMDALTKVLVMLYDEPEKPVDALEYIRKHLGDNNRPDDAELNVLKTDLEESRLKIQSLEDEVNLLKERLAQYEPPEGMAMEEGEPSVLAENEGGEQAEITESTGVVSGAASGGATSTRVVSAGGVSAGAASAGPGSVGAASTEGDQPTASVLQ